MKNTLVYSASSAFLASQIVNIVMFYSMAPDAIRSDVMGVVTVIINLLLVAVVKHFKLSDIIVEEKVKTAKISK